MFGFGERGTTNLMTRALAAVGKKLETVPDPTQIHYHLPPGPRHPQVRCPGGLGAMPACLTVAARSRCLLLQDALAAPSTHVTKFSMLEPITPLKSDSTCHTLLPRMK
jgi:hypothetical protein